MLLRRPGSTLFPYTTLFRSPHRPQQRTAIGRTRRAGSARRCGDRKSTRLNSSHLVISYAVFCLKKKTEYEQEFAARPGWEAELALSLQQTVERLEVRAPLVV